MSRFVTTALLFSLVHFVAGVGACAEPEEAEDLSTWKQWLSKGMDPAWWREQWSESPDIAKAVAQASARLDLEQVKSTFAVLADAIRTEDVSKIQVASNELEKMLSVEKLDEGLCFLIIQRQKGGDAAVHAVDEYAARKDLNEIEKVAAQNLKEGMTLLQRDDIQGYMILAICFACESKMGAHQGMLIAAPLISLLFPEYIKKHGSTAFKP